MNVRAKELVAVGLLCERLLDFALRCHVGVSLHLLSLFTLVKRGCKQCALNSHTLNRSSKSANRRALLQQLQDSANI